MRQVLESIVAEHDSVEEHIANKLATLRRRTSVESVPCPQCGAMVDMPCVTATKRARKSPHVERQAHWLDVNKTNTETRRSASEIGAQLVMNDS